MSPQVFHSVIYSVRPMASYFAHIQEFLSSFSIGTSEVDPGDGRSRDHYSASSPHPLALPCCLSPPTLGHPGITLPQGFDHVSPKHVIPFENSLTHACFFPLPRGEFLETAGLLLDGWISRLERDPVEFLADGVI